MCVFVYLCTNTSRALGHAFRTQKTKTHTHINACVQKNIHFMFAVQLIKCNRRVRNKPPSAITRLHAIKMQSHSHQQPSSSLSLSFRVRVHNAPAMVNIQQTHTAKYRICFVRMCINRSMRTDANGRLPQKNTLCRPSVRPSGQRTCQRAYV